MENIPTTSTPQPLTPIPYDIFHSLQVHAFELYFIREMLAILSLKSVERLIASFLSLRIALLIT